MPGFLKTCSKNSIKQLLLSIMLRLISQSFIAMWFDNTTTNNLMTVIRVNWQYLF